MIEYTLFSVGILLYKGGQQVDLEMNFRLFLIFFQKTNKLFFFFIVILSVFVKLMNTNIRLKNAINNYKKRNYTLRSSVGMLNVI